jgi:hypothetical protein
MSRTRPHINLNEQLLFEIGSAGRRAYDLPPLDTPLRPLAEIVPTELLRERVEGMPELSEVEVVRHFTRLSTWNYHIDLGLYPLGSCTMKHNPKVNETVARLPGFTNAHPYMPPELVQGVLRVQAALGACLTEITGMDAVTLQPAAGAHGELTGILMIRAYHEARGNPRRRVLVPDSAHGTNPASVAISGYLVDQIPSNTNGTVDLERLRQAMGDDVDYTFNWFYADSTHTAYYNSGDNPVRATGVDSEFPVWAQAAPAANPAMWWRADAGALNSSGLPAANGEQVRQAGGKVGEIAYTDSRYCPVITAKPIATAAITSM